MSDTWIKPPRSVGVFEERKRNGGRFDGVMVDGSYKSILKRMRKGRSKFRSGKVALDPKGGYPSNSRTVSELPKPPSGPAPGSESNSGQVNEVISNHGQESISNSGQMFRLNSGQLTGLTEGSFDMSAPKTINVLDYTKAGVTFSFTRQGDVLDIVVKDK